MHRARKRKNWKSIHLFAGPSDLRTISHVHGLFDIFYFSLTCVCVCVCGRGMLSVCDDGKRRQWHSAFFGLPETWEPRFKLTDRIHVFSHTRNACGCVCVCMCACRSLSLVRRTHRSVARVWTSSIRRRTSSRCHIAYHRCSPIVIASNMRNQRFFLFIERSARLVSCVGRMRVPVRWWRPWRRWRWQQQ